MLCSAQRQAVQQTDMLLAAGRVQWQDEVRPRDGRSDSFCITDVGVSDASAAQRQAVQQTEKSL